MTITECAHSCIVYPTLPCISKTCHFAILAIQGNEDRSCFDARTAPIACDETGALLDSTHTDVRQRMAEPAVQIKHWTRREYDRMAEVGIFGPDDHVQLIEGAIITMTPQNSPHASAIGKTQRALERVFGIKVWVRVQMPLIVDPDSEPEPDLAVVPGTPDDYRNEHPRSALLVVEVSDTTLSLDRHRKRAIYARAGIQEYWIVNLAERCLEVYRDPVASPEQASEYRSSQKLSPSESLAPLAAPTATVAVADLLP